MSTGTTGSVYQRADGYWAAAVSLNGRRIVKYAKTEKAARAKLKELLVAEQGHTLTPPTRTTLDAWVTQWMTLQATERRLSTLKTYRDTLRPILARLGSVRLDKLTPAGLGLTFAELRRQGIGTRRVQQGYAALKTCLGAAVGLGIIAVNPLDRVAKPKHQAGRHHIWTAEQAAAFIATAATSHQQYAPLLLLLVGAGLRLSEGLALTWDDLDLGAGTVTVSKALVFVGHRPALGPTKSAAGNRVISLPAPLPAVLTRLPRPLDDSAPIFRTRGGLPPGQTVLRDTMRQLCERAAVPVIRIHDLRHVHASVLVAAGIDLATVSRRLGHSKVSTTAGIYTHAVRPDSTAAEAFTRAIGS